MLAADVIARFDQDGFVVAEDFFAPAELEEFGRAIDVEVSARTVHDTRGMSEKTRYEQSFVQCMRLWETSHSVRRLTFDRRLARAASELLGVDRLRLWQDQALYKEPGGRETTAHQDLVFWPIEHDAPLISAWIPLDGSTVANGAMAYVPGSHRAGPLRSVDITHRSEPFEVLKDPALGGRGPVWVEAPVGSVVWHHGLTVHLAAPNNTAETRRVFTVVYLGDGVLRTKSWPLLPLDREGIEVGDTVEGPGIPMAWPPADELPEPHEVVGVPSGPQH